MAKITKSTLKSFIRKNEGNLYIWTKSTFDGMVDGVMPSDERGFTKALPADCHYEHNLGVHGAWLVLGSRDHFSEYNDEKFTGIDVYNCCGHFIIATKK